MLIHDSHQHDGTSCDVCNAPRSCHHRFAIIAQGATGRWCEVLWLCDECGGGDMGMQLDAMDIRTARAWCLEQGPGSHPDF